MKGNLVKILLAQNSAFIANRLPRAARALKEAGYEVEILNWNRGVNAEVITEATRGFEAEGIKVHSIYCGETPYGKGIQTIVNKLRFTMKVMQFLRKHGNDYAVVHAIDFDLGLPVALAKAVKRSAKFKIVYDIADFVETFHSPMPQFVRKLVKALSERVMQKASKIVLPDENRLINIPAQLQSKVVLVNNSIDPPNMLPTYPIETDSQKLNVFYYGALSMDRGIELLMAQQNVAIWFAGKGELQPQIEEKAQNSNNIHYLGYLSFAEVLAVANQMDLIYMVYDPSYQHNQIASPNKLYEALYLGKPCIVAVNTSIDQFVDKHSIGYVTKFDKNSLANVLQLITKEDLVQKGNHAKAIYPQYSWAHSKTTLVEMYDELTKQGGNV